MTDPDFLATPANLGTTPISSELVLQTVRSLRRSFQYALLLLLILSASVFVFILREVSAARRQNVELGRIVADYQRVGAPTLEDFRKKLLEYGRTHPDFSPIMAKYFAPTNLPAQNAPPMAPFQQ